VKHRVSDKLSIGKVLLLAAGATTVLVIPIIVGVVNASRSKTATTMKRPIRRWPTDIVMFGDTTHGGEDLVGNNKDRERSTRQQSEGVD
jgi:hypothetical protein